MIGAFLLIVGIILSYCYFIARVTKPKPKHMNIAEEVPVPHESSVDIPPFADVVFTAEPSTSL